LILGLEILEDIKELYEEKVKKEQELNNMEA
jgi:hypothetical protein